MAIVLGVFFRGYHLDHKTFWGDEIFGEFHTLGYTEAEIVRAGPQVRSAGDIQAYFRLDGAGHDSRPLGATIASLADEDPQHPPLYYVLVRLWAGLAGTSILALRTLPALFGIMALGAMAWLGRELFGNWRAGGIAAALYALSPFAVLYAQEAREYSLWALAMLVSSAVLLQALRTRRRAPWLVYCASSVIGLYIYPLTAFVMVAQFLFVATTPELRRQGIVPCLLSNACAAVLFVPWLLVANLGHGPRGMDAFLFQRLSPAAIGTSFLRNIRSSVLDFGAVDGRGARLAVSAIGVMVVILIVIAVANLFRRDLRGKARGIFVLALLVVPALPLLAHDAFSGGALVSQGRYFVPAYLATSLALAGLFSDKIADEQPVGAATLGWELAFGFVLMVGLASCAFSSQASTWYNKALQRSAAVAAIVNHADRPLVVGDRAAVNDRGTSRVLELSYYLDPGIAMRVNMHCDVCRASAPPPTDVFAAADDFHDVFVLGELARAVPSGSYTVHQIGIDIDPATPNPLNMFEPYPH